MTTVTLTMDVRVTDRQDIYLAAMGHAINVDGLTEKAARDLLAPGGEIDVEACVVMLIDPGSSPPGMEILETTAEAA